jgi:preprotein translocase subunit SecG
MPFVPNNKNKTKLLVGLFALIIIVMLNNYSGRSKYADLDKTISSIYKDRLLPAGYLFSISDLLYQKKLLLQQHEGPLPAQAKASLDHHNTALLTLLKQYDATYLTVAEKAQWGLFKALLLQYNIAEATGRQALLQQPFSKAIACLNELTAIQLAEGKALEHRSKDLLGGSLLQSYFEIAVLFVVCILMLALTGFEDRRHTLSPDQVLLN